MAIVRILRFSGIISLLIIICLLTVSAEAQYNGGTGEPNDPYQIATAEDLMLLGETPDDYDKHFILTNDIDLDPNLPDRTVFDRAVIAPDTDNSQGDFQGSVFSGIFDGNGHIISNLTIDTAGVAKDYLALFGEIRGENAEVKNISVVNHKIISGDGYPEFSGGLIGRNFNGSISNCCAIGSITGGDSAENFGGLCGHNDFGTISNCYAAGSVTGNSCDYLGGLCGESFGNIINCYATTTVVGEGESWNLGGLCGGNTGTISNCYAKGSVISNNNDSVYLGGLCGENSGLISNCYAAGVVDVGNGSNYTGGLCGYNDINGYISNCFWNIQTSGRIISDGGTGKTTAEMKTAVTFLEAGWDFVDETKNGTEDIWKIFEGLDYPRLWWEKYGGGMGEPNDPYLIYTAKHLNEVSVEPNDWDKHFKLMADIDLSGYSYETALIAPDVDPRKGFNGTSFMGVIDGNGHTISNLTITGLTITGESYLGLIGSLGSGAEVTNLGLLDVNITGYGIVGGLVGSNDGNISTSYCTGTISGDFHVGGLSGSNWRTITASYSAVAVTANRCAGGLVGNNGGSITNSYNTGAVTANLDASGLAGDNIGSITTCYSTGTVSGKNRPGGLVGVNFGDAVITSCFWDIEASGLTNMCGSQGDDATGCDNTYGKTTTEMQTASTFLDAGWDFVDETANGTEDIWWINEGLDYPKLWWEADNN
jgi:hypothetical protein